MESNSVDTLTNFISAAEKSRKYPTATAYNIRTALKLITPTLTDDEKKSLDLFEKNLGQIFHEHYNKNQTKMSAGSLETYKSRVKKVILDYKKYGQDPTKMANWNPVTKTRKPRIDHVKADIQPIESQNPVNAKQLINSLSGNYENMTKFELPLRDDAKALILTPKDLNKEDIKKIQAYISFLDSITH